MAIYVSVGNGTYIIHLNIIMCREGGGDMQHVIIIIIIM